MAEAVDRVRDRLGKAVDPGIHDTVTALNFLDLPTSQSCEGHVNLRGHGLAAPWVDFAHDDTPADLPDRLRALLDAFYDGREVRPDLRLRYCGLRRRLSNGGDFEELDDLRRRLAEGRSTPEETRRARQALADRQDEMRRFTRFLLRGESWFPGACPSADRRSVAEAPGGAVDGATRLDPLVAAAGSRGALAGPRRAGGQGRPEMVPDGIGAERCVPRRSSGSRASDG